MKNRLGIFSSWLTLCAILASPCHAETVVLSVPGPGSLSYLPVYLAKAISADQAEGLDLKLRYVAGGPLALRDLNDNNSDFAAVGLPAIAAARADGMPLLGIGQLSQSAMFVLLLRADLKNQVHSIAQLKGKRIGTSANSSTSRSMGTMMTGYLLQRAGLKPDDVRYITSGQNRESTRAALTSQTVDAILGDEPFASELVAQGIAIKLADLYLPATSNALLGGPIVHSALATREQLYAEHPATVKKVQRMLDRALEWLAQHTAQQVADQLDGQPGFDTASSKALVPVLQHNAGMFTHRTAWDAQAVANTERFFHGMSEDLKESRLSFSSFVRN